MRAIIGGMLVQLRSAALTPLALVTAYLTPLSIALLVIARLGRPEISLLIGTIAAAVLNALVVQTFFAISDERFSGTMQILAATPAGLLAPLIGRLLGVLVQGLVALPVAVLLVAAVWGPTGLKDVISDGSLPLALVGLLVATCGVCSMAVVHVGMVVRSNSYRGLVNAIFPVSVIAMGFYTSVRKLPLPVRLVSDLLPPAWAMDAVWTGSYRPMLLSGLTAVIWAGAGVTLLRGLPAWLRTSPETYTR